MKKHPAWQLDPSTYWLPNGIGFVASQHKHSILLAELTSCHSISSPKENNGFAAGFNRRDAGLLEGIHDNGDGSLASCGAGKT